MTSTFHLLKDKPTGAPENEEDIDLQGLKFPMEAAQVVDVPLMYFEMPEEVSSIFEDLARASEGMISLEVLSESKSGETIELKLKVNGKESIHRFPSAPDNLLEHVMVVVQGMFAEHSLGVYWFTSGGGVAIGALGCGEKLVASGLCPQSGSPFEMHGVIGLATSVYWRRWNMSTLSASPQRSAHKSRWRTSR